jgi:superfamily I DNA and/or RNA helicase
MEVKQLIDKKSEYWKKKLIDLSKRNNLINYRFTKSKSLQIKEPNFKQIIEDLNHEKNVNILKKENGKPKERFWLCTEEEDTVDKKLTNLYLKTKENFQELGISTCFVSLGVLKYKEAKHSEMYSQAPIFLYPITLNRLSSTSKDKHRFELVSGSEDIQVNPALIEKLSHDFDINFPEFKEQSIEEYLNSVKKVISGMKDWKVTEEIYIDVFSYQKYIIYKDLMEHNKLLQESDLVKAFVGDRSALQDEIAETQRNEFDDAQDIDVLPADSSQKLAIELAKAGTTFVLQGPPGTGKSQTISNIIAALLEKKKKILFVSQKMAALNVVNKRLEEVGLGRYCLNLHNYKGNKKEVIRQLISELETSPKIKESVKRYSFADYIENQKDLNNFYDFLCKKHKPRSLSIYDIRGELAKLHSIEILDKNLNDCISSNEEKFTRLLSKIQNLDLVIEKIPMPMENIYFNFKASKNTTLSRNKFKTLIDSTHQTLKEILEFIKEIENRTKLDIKTLKELEEFCEFHNSANKIKDVPDFFISDEFDNYKKIISDLSKNLSEINEIKSKILEKTKGKFVEEKTDSYERVFRETSFLARVFNKDYKNTKEELQRFSDEKLGHSDWVKLFELKKEYSKTIDKHQKLESQNKKCVKNLGDIYSEQNLDKLDKKADEFAQIHKNSEKLSKKSVKIIHFWMSEKPKEDSFEYLKKVINEVDDYLSKSILSNSENIEEIEGKIHEFIENINHLDDVLVFKEEYDSLNNEMKEFIKKYFTDNIISKLSSVFLKSYYLQLLEELLKENNISSPKNKVEQFREKDFEVRDIQRYKIMDSIEQNQPSVNYHSRGTNEVSILKRENEKKRRLKPIRNLLEDISNLVFTLKPCFMMSPLSVSQYINPSAIKFDVVIFDEASQIMPEDAVSCLIRAKQAIVVGDTQQLPPTSFFMSGRDDEIVEEEIEDLESFLSECSTKFRTKPLLWHYRSKNEHLIAFSNRFFYEHRLITFPNARIKDDSGLDFVHVKSGVYDRGKSRKNRVEAREIVKKYKELKKKFPEKSIGIIAFSIAQENAIREEFRVAGINIDESIDSYREDLFIKNLETVQGDERDIILISIGYGKDSSGKLSYHFGPLNRDGGYKRLNVAITRSRFKTVVISSISPEDLDEDKINVDGVRYLKYYLDYAKNKDFNKFLQTTEGLDFDSSFEESVYETLVNEGFSVSTQIGCSGYRVDLAIKHPKNPGVYLLGVECDGAQYHSSRFARDRDKVRQLILENLGWNIHRIWSDDWLNNRDYEIKKIKEKVVSLLKSKKDNFRKEDKFEKVEDVEDFKEVSLKEKYNKYEVVELSQRRIDYNEIDYHSDLIKKRMLQVLEVEAPIDIELLFKRILASIGIQKLGKRITEEFVYLLKDLKSEYNNVYLYDRTASIDKIDAYSSVRISTEKQRPFTLIPKEEIAGAIVDILKNTFSATKETLVADIAKGIYHNNRTGDKIKAKIDEAVKHLLKKNVVKQDNGKLVLEK